MGKQHFLGGRGVSGWKVSKRRCQGWGRPSYAPDQAGQSDQMSRLRGSLSLTLAGFLRKVGSACPGRIRLKGEVSWKGGERSLTKVDKEKAFGIPHGPDLWAFRLLPYHHLYLRCSQRKSLSFLVFLPQ